MKKNIVIFLFPVAFFLANCQKTAVVKNDDSTPTLPTTPPPPPPASVDTLANGAVKMAGANWADGRDNFQDGWVIPSKLSASDTYSDVQLKADPILSGFIQDGINTIRLPINPPSVSESWWNSYKGAIDKALSKGMKVILCCWESNSSKDGRVDDGNLFWGMWQKVINDYGKNPRVYFEVFNEPHGYNLVDLEDLYSNFLLKYPTIAKNRILLSGTGYSEDVTKIGADSRFNGCLLAIHDYSFFVNNSIKTAAAWETRLRSKIGAYSKRTVMTEFGSPMTAGKNYIDAIKDDGEKAFIQGVTNVFHLDSVSSIYWPGLRDNDRYSLYNFNGTSMVSTNASGLNRMKYGWGVGNGGTDVFYPDAFYRILNRNSNLSLDVNGGSKDSGAALIQWYPNGGDNQQWVITDNGSGYFKILNKNSNLSLDVKGSSTADTASIVQMPWAGENHQQWQIDKLGSDYYTVKNRNSLKALGILGASKDAGSKIAQSAVAGKPNQQWLILQQ
ncbi:endoglucanase [Pedobacter sp. UYP30]|uniref:RICIN domain-containing protein n=1 Tax=Pedobacter sp. UYP30 TaxID=1756400 RepID=UPI003393AB9E